jgi:hypothetical protein
MRHQEDTAGTWHRAIPPVEAYLILGLKRHILALEPHGVPIANGIARWDKDQTLFEDHGAPDEQEIGHCKAHGEMEHALSLGGRWRVWCRYLMPPSRSDSPSSSRRGSSASVTYSR